MIAIHIPLNLCRQGMQLSAQLNAASSSKVLCVSSNQSGIADVVQVCQ